MSNKIVSIYVWRGKAYFPAHGQFRSGIYAIMEPVNIVELELGALVTAAREVIAREVVDLPDILKDEVRKHPDPLLKAAKARSWKELAATGASYGISWTDRQTFVSMSYRDKQGRWLNDPAKTRILPLDTPLENIITMILADIYTRPEVFETEPTK